MRDWLKEVDPLTDEIVKCPECGSQRNYKAGMRYTHNGEIQRYLCRDCAYRFTIKS